MNLISESYSKNKHLNENVLDVWIVDDDEQFRSKLTELLNLSDELNCQQTFNAVEPLLKIIEKNDPPDLILMDIGLPGINGIEGIKLIHKIIPEVKFVVLTVFEDTDNIIKAISSGASGYLLKDSPLTVIIDSLKSILSGGAPINPQIAKKILDFFTKVHPTADYGLTPREKEVLIFLVDGLPKKQIADQMSITFHTVDKHLRSIYTKLRVPSRSLAVVKAIKENLL